jgi:hypothetical protein
MLRKAKIGKPRILLQQPALREGDGLIAGDDEVVQHLDLHERQRFLEARG